MAKRRPDHVDAIVAQWAAERPELDTGALALVGRLMRTAALAEEALVPPLRERGLEPGWLDVLAALRRSGPRHELNPKHLLETVMLSSGGMTKRLDQLERAGLVKRSPDPGDRRGTLVRLTPRGRRTIDRAIEAHIDNEQRLLAPLDGAERRGLDALLRKLLAGVERARTGDIEEAA
jgi:DNA-binding MarR family transcriptional regulator